MYNTKEIFELYNELQSFNATAKRLGIDSRTVKRHVEKFHDENSFVVSEANRTGIPVGHIGHYWLKTRNEEGDDVSIFVKNKNEMMEYDELRDRLMEDLQNFAPHCSRIEYNELPEDKQHLLVLDPADVHIGKLSLTEETGQPEYNINVAVNRVYSGVSDLLIKASKFGVHHIVLVVGNDILHIDTPRRTTTSGTPQDTDGQWWSMFESARDMYISIIEMAKGIAPVSIVFCPSNHDYMLGFALTDSIYSWYRNDENVDVSSYSKSMRHRKYIHYGNNLIGITHGDGAKNKDLPSLMQYEARTEWANSRFSYWYVHHMHHKYRTINTVEFEKDYAGVTVIGNFHSVDLEKNVSVECIRSPSEADGWHSRNGYVNTTAIEAFLHHPVDGQIARLTSYV